MVVEVDRSIDLELWAYAGESDTTSSSLDESPRNGFVNKQGKFEPPGEQIFLLSSFDKRTVSIDDHMRRFYAPFGTMSWVNADCEVDNELLY
eukprot:CAMPEP_0194044216 /NCGR_PEP_ID=MMETSP0009_2-20130614/15714_1 /TAXON_ID=210454 /ORGANISM="Grammatophora oceanica, Strain CCMP 410" /LENGTH=91 /DNA_ID=CAMNT_0038688669 /DNA_START=333 /DNA_END=605 /DNA_ORIENTATION=+